MPSVPLSLRIGAALAALILLAPAFLILHIGGASQDVLNWFFALAGLVVLVFEAAVPPAFGALRDKLSRHPYILEHQIVTITIRNAAGDISYKVEQEVKNLAGRPRPWVNSEIRAMGATPPELSDIPVLGQDGTRLAKDPVSKDGRHRYFRVRFPAPLERYETFRYWYEVEMPGILPTRDGSHNLTWDPLVPIKRFSVRIRHKDGAAAAAAIFSNDATEEPLGRPRVDGSQIDLDVSRLPAGSYRLEWWLQSSEATAAAGSAPRPTPTSGTTPAP